MVDLIEYFLIHNCLLISFFSNKLASFRLLKRKQTQLSISKMVRVTNNLLIQFTEIGLHFSRNSTINRSKNLTSFKAICFLFEVRS